MIEKVVHAIDATFDRFASADWAQKSASEHESFDVAIKPDRPLNFAVQCDRSYGIQPGSPLFDARVKPVVEQLQGLTDITKAAALAKQIDGKTEFSIDSDANVFVAGDRDADFAHDLGAKGAAFSFCERGDQLDCYVVFGNPARWKPKGDGSRAFAYAHPNGVPAIENLVIHFHAKSPTGMAADRIHELIRTTDWTPIDRSLTK